MRKFLSLSAVAAALAFAASANAAVIVTVTNLGPATDNLGDVATGYSAYMLTASTDDGGVITSIDMGQSVGSPYTGITGPLLQDWDIGRSGESATPIENGQMVDSNYGLDSHWLFTGNSSTAAPVEDNSGVNPPGSPADVPGNGGADFGVGTFLGGNQGIAAANQTTSVAFAYVVLQNGTGAAYDINISEHVGGTDIGSVDVGTIGSTTPEPASLALLGLGGLALLRRRRKA